MQTGAMSSVSHLGCVATPVHPPLQLTLAPQFTWAEASSLHSPLHLPLQLDEHLPWHMAAGCGWVQRPSQVPVQLAMPPEGVAVPSHLPSHMPMHPPSVLP